MLSEIYIHLSIVAGDVTDKVNIEETNTVWSQSLLKDRGMHC